jgi:CHAD domain-containing protein
MQTGTFASESVTKLLERLAYQVNRTVHTANVEAVHDLRVSIRRFAQSLYLFKSAFAAKEVRKIRGRLKDMMDLTNGPRDCDVAMALLCKRKLPGTPALEPAIRERRKESVRLLVPALRRWIARDSSSKWRSALTPNGGSQDPLDETVRDRVPRLLKRLLKAGNRAESADDLHQLRLDGKKFRYSLELLQPVHNGRMQGALDLVTTMQSLLGRVNDCRAVRKLVQELGGDAEIERWLKRRQKKKIREFREHWPAIEQALRESLVLMRAPAIRKPVRRAMPAPAAEIARHA